MSDSATKKEERSTEAAHKPSWYPPAADEDPENENIPFENQFDDHFHVPSRIAQVNSELIETVNDFHFAMMNDVQRNQFYYDALKAVVGTETVVIEIGTGSGLLAMISAKLGAKHVTAIEANRSLASLARYNIRKNGFEDRVTVINKMSTDVRPEDLPFGKADVLVSEILGTLLLSESALEYNEDARKRLLKKDGSVIPGDGVQCVTLIQSEKLDLISTARNWKGLDLASFNRFRDTSSLIFTKQLGCRITHLNYKPMSLRIPIIRCDFSKGTCDAAPPRERRIRFHALETGTIHAAVYSWEVHSPIADGTKITMSTHPEDTVNQLARDMQWGQGIQLLDDYVASEERNRADEDADSRDEAFVMLRV